MDTGKERQFILQKMVQTYSIDKNSAVNVFFSQCFIFYLTLL